MNEKPASDRVADLAAKLGADKITKTLPTKFATAFDDAANQPKNEAIRYNNAPLDKDRVENKPTDNIDQKVYWFPASYNALRVEMHDNWPNLWQLVGRAMAFDAVIFCQLMDAALDTKTTFDTHTVDGICKKYLDLLRAKRGLSSLHTPSEKA